MKKVLSMLLFLMIVTSSIYPSLSNDVEDTNLRLQGTPGTIAPVSSLKTCTDPALKFINCDGWMSKRATDGNFRGTTVIMDVGLSVSEWKDIETEYNDGVYLDIIKYLVLDSSGSYIEYGGVGKDDLTNIAKDDGATDFVMPGDGVPIASDTWKTFYYGKGTSFSTPYLAAAIVAIYAFNKGHLEAGGYYFDPTVSQIYRLLRGAASGGGTFNQYMGYGNVDFLELYNDAYNLGYNSGSSSGGGCYIWRC